MTFLEQLQESAGLLNNKIKDTDTTQIKSLFGNYNPNLASDYVATPFGQPIAQNRFLGNEFQMPNLSGQTYTPGAMAPGAGFNFGNMGTFTPGAFNQYGNIPVTGNIPSNIATTTIQDRGGNGPNQNTFSGQFESFGNQTFSIDEDGNPTLVEGTPFTTPLLGLLSGIGKLVPGEEARRFENLDEATQNQLFGLLDEETKKTLAGEVDTNVTRDYTNQGLISKLTPAEQARLALTDEQRNIVSKRSGYGPFGLGAPSEAERAKALQAQQNARDLQKQAEKERQAREASNSRPSTGGASREKQQANRDLGASRGFNTGGR
jgi:hypothetical protein